MEASDANLGDYDEQHNGHRRKGEDKRARTTADGRHHLYLSVLLYARRTHFVSLLYKQVAEECSS